MKEVLNWIKFYKLGIVIASVFFVVGVATLSHYGLNIDEPIHFIRGHAYLHLLLTGQDRYNEKDLSGPRVSDWKLQQYNGAYFLINDSGHPPLNGILAAASNRIFYERLGILGDLESYHLFEIFTSAFLVFLVFVIATQKFGIFAGVIASLSLSLYPLFLGESHFNIKDPVQATFFAGTIYFLYLGIERVKAKFFFISAFFCAFAFGIKFNIVFLPFIILPYLFFRYFPPNRYLSFENLKNVPIPIYIAILFYPVIVFGVHFITRPYFWADPLDRFLEIIEYYQGIGTGNFLQPEYIFQGWNLYTPFFIAIATPLWILALSVIGVVASIFNIRRERDKFSLLLLLWLVVPILRVMWPGSSIYSGVRQIMEYIPAMAILAGLGAHSLIGKFKFQILFVLATGVLLLIPIIRLHPNESIYINSLAGGLKGAVEKKVPGAGETMGNIYLQGVLWLNKYAKKDALVGLPVGHASNIPRQFMRADLKLGPYFSGVKRGGEYMLEMLSIDFPPPRYNYLYLERFLNPVHVIEVDGVPLLKIWKNDKEHTKEGYYNEVEENDIEIIGGKDEGFIKVILREPAYVTRLEIEHDNKQSLFHRNKNCETERSGGIIYSLDDENVQYAPDDLFNTQGPYATSLLTDNFFVYFFPAYHAKFIQLTPADPSSCLLLYKKVTLRSLRDIKP